MKGLDKALKELDKMAQNEREALEEARKAQEEANRLRQEAEEKERKATEAQTKIEIARNATEEAREAAESIDSTNSNNKNNGKKILTAVGAIVLIGALAVGGYVLIKEVKSGKIKDDNDLDRSMSDSLDETENNSTSYDEENNILLVEDNYEPLTNENFENLVSEYAKKYNEEYDGIIETKDIVKFASIANIDVLSEDNKDLASELFGEQSKEEYLNDAAKLIGATVMYNFNEWNSTLSTKNFIRVSNIIYGEQKDKMLKIEEYTDRIASAVIMNDEDLVNNIVSEFLTDMNSGSLSKLDDGVGFAAQVNIAVIADGIARNYLNKENFDMFQVLKTSEKYVSNIFTEYEECTNTNSDVKTLTK